MRVHWTRFQPAFHALHSIADVRSTLSSDKTKLWRTIRCIGGVMAARRRRQRRGGDKQSARGAMAARAAAGRQRGRGRRRWAAGSRGRGPPACQEIHQPACRVTAVNTASDCNKSRCKKSNIAAPLRRYGNAGRRGGAASWGSRWRQRGRRCRIWGTDGTVTVTRSHRDGTSRMK